MTFNQWGLILNAVGSLILCIYGLPNNYFSKSGSSVLNIITANDNLEENKKYNKGRKMKAYVGIFLLFFGFLLQFFATF